MSELPPLNTDTIWGILNDQIDDATVMQLVWYYLGYRYDATTEKWDNNAVPSEWRDEYPEPPNFLESRPDRKSVV